MASLDSLPADQRAVLQLVLQRGRSYDEIARLLSIDRAAVRQRALTAFDLLGPQTGVEDQRRALITDYLLGQLPPAVAEQTRDRLAESPSERAWARVLASELAPLTKEPLPEIPSSREPGTDQPYTDEPFADAAPVAAEAAATESKPKKERQPLFLGRNRKPKDESKPKKERQPLFLGRNRTPAGEKAPKAAKPKKERQPLFLGRSRNKPKAEAPEAPKEPEGPKGPETAAATLIPEQKQEPGSSRLGGAILIILAAIAVIAVVVVVIGNSGGSKSSTSPSSTVASTPSAASSGTASTATSGTSSGKVLAQINLTSPVSGSKAVGIADVLKEGTANGIAIVAQNVTPNTTHPPNAYAVWLYNSASDAHILGFVNPGVGQNGRLSTAGALPTNAAHFKQLIVTVETKANPTAPGTIVLQGALKL